MTPPLINNTLIMAPLWIFVLCYFSHVYVYEFRSTSSNQKQVITTATCISLFFRKFPLINYNVRLDMLTVWILRKDWLNNVLSSGVHSYHRFTVFFWFVYFTFILMFVCFFVEQILNINFWCFFIVYSMVFMFKNVKLYFKTKDLVHSYLKASSDI